MDTRLRVLFWWVLLAIFFGCFGSVSAQNFSERDSLLLVLQNTDKPSELLVTKYELGWVYYPTFPDSMQYYFKQVISETDEPELIAKSERGIGVSLYLQTDYDQAMQHNLKALSAFQELGDAYGMAKTYNSIGLNLASMKSYQPALEYHWKSIGEGNRLLEQLTDPDSIRKVRSMLGHNYINLSVSYEEAPQKDSAVHYTQKSIELFQSMEDSFYLAMSYNRQAQALYRLGNFSEALRRNQYVLDTFKALNPFEEVFTYLGLAQNLVELGELERGEYYGLKGYKLAKEIGATWHLQHFMRVLADCYAQQEEYKKAYRYQVEYKAISDSLFNEGNEKRINHMLLQQKDLVNDRLLQQNQLKEEQLTVKNQQIVLYLGGVFSLGLFLLLQYRYSRKLKKLNLRLNTLNAELEASNSTKDKFFSIVSHDLRSPFNAIIGFIKLLKMRIEQFNKEELLEFIDLMLITTNNTYKLLENILTWSRIQTGNMPYNPEPIALPQLIGESTALLAKVAQEKEIELTINKIPEIMVYADRNMIGTVLRNLISNAIKFTKRGKSVSVSAEIMQTKARIAVSDTGKGISPEVMERLFDIAETISTEGTEKEKGTGLGLTLSNEFVEKHAGKLSVESEVGKGSTFSFTLPLQQ